MFELFRAEWVKVLGMRRPVAYLLFIFPALTCLVLGVFCLAAALDADGRQTSQELFGNWQKMMTVSWTIASHMVSRLFLVAFTVVVVAGEYQWGTWKNLLPRRGRVPLLLNKLAVVGVLVVLTFVFESFLLLAGGRLVTWIAQVDYAPAVSASELAGYLPVYLGAAAVSFLSYLMTGVFAVLAAVYSRTILGGTLTGFVLIFVERLLLLVPPQLAGYLEMPKLVHLGRVLPIYNVENIRAWMLTNAPGHFYDWGFTSHQLAPPEDSMTFSVLVLAFWIGLGLSAACVLFERQDITS